MKTSNLAKGDYLLDKHKDANDLHSILTALHQNRKT